MTDTAGTTARSEHWPAAASVGSSVLELRPDYRALLMTVEGIVPGPSDVTSEALLQKAEAAARKALADHKVEDLPHVAAWRDAYRSFGAKPQRTRNSLETLLRRAEAGLPRVNRLTDIDNAVSVLHQVPIGGEDLTRYSGPPRLIRASGHEPFDTVADDAGVTCRRWNWRQARRTALADDTTTALFILDALDRSPTRRSPPPPTMSPSTSPGSDRRSASAAERSVPHR